MSSIEETALLTKLAELPGGCYALSDMPRRDAAVAQRIAANTNHLRIINEIVCLTEPGRAVLKKRVSKRSARKLKL